MITQEQLQQISRLVNSRMMSETVVGQLRGSFPDLHFTYCRDDDVIAANPVHADTSYNLYLVDSRSHCLCFTQDMEVATGVVVAEIETA